MALIIDFSNLCFMIDIKSDMFDSFCSCINDYCRKYSGISVCVEGDGIDNDFTDWLGSYHWRFNKVDKIKLFDLLRKIPRDFRIALSINNCNLVDDDFKRLQDVFGKFETIDFGYNNIVNANDFINYYTSNFVYSNIK